MSWCSRGTGTARQHTVGSTSAPMRGAPPLMGAAGVTSTIGTQACDDDELAFWESPLLRPGEEDKREWSRLCPWNESQVATGVIGTLSHLGAASHRANGIFLRRRYVHQFPLLSHTLAPEQVSARSTPFPRCVESAQNLLLGLYPEKHRDSGSAGQSPITVEERAREPMYGAWFATAEQCPRVLQLLHQLYDEDHAQMNDDDADLESRVQREVCVCPNGNLGLSDAIRCQQQCVHAPWCTAPAAAHSATGTGCRSSVAGPLRLPPGFATTAGAPSCSATVCAPRHPLDAPAHGDAHSPCRQSSPNSMG